MELSNGEKLRVGVLLDSYLQPRWVHKIISDIQESSIATVVLAVLNEHNQQAKKGIAQKIWKQRKHLLYKAYSKVDDLLFRVHPDAFQRIGIEPLLAGCSVLRVKPVQKKHSDFFEADDIAAIRELNLDVLLRFGFRILRGDILNAARFGVWSYHHGDNREIRGGPPGFWEVMQRRDLTGSVLQILTEDLDAGKVIYRSFSSTNKRSVKRNKNKCYWKSTAFVLRKLKDLREEGITGLNGDSESEQYQPYSHPLYRPPSNTEILPYLTRLAFQTTSEKFSDIFFWNQWILAYNLSRNEEAFYKFKTIRPPADRYWADPFPVQEKDKYFIFIEEFLYGRKKGHISVMEMDNSGSFTSPARVLDMKEHLSYPFLFQWRGVYYMIPETSQKRTVELYRCVSFPSEWKLETVLLENVKAVDATLLEQGDDWWMFVNIAVEGGSTFDELHLFHANSPMGPWKPHRRNPVKSDCRNTRPAGKLFHYRDQLYRPAQDCSVRYGFAISMNQILKLDSREFIEKEVSKTYPQWAKGLLATHTYNRAGSLTMIDGMARSRKSLFPR